MSTKRIKAANQGAPERLRETLNPESILSEQGTADCKRSKGADIEAPPLLAQLQNPAEQHEKERLAYSVQEAADRLGIHYFSVYRLIQRRKLRACRILSGKLLIPRSELERLLKT